MGLLLLALRLIGLRLPHRSVAHEWPLLRLNKWMQFLWTKVFLLLLLLLLLLMLFRSSTYNISWTYPIRLSEYSSAYGLLRPVWALTRWLLWRQGLLSCCCYIVIDFGLVDWFKLTVGSLSNPNFPNGWVLASLLVAVVYGHYSLLGLELMKLWFLICNNQSGHQVVFRVLFPFQFAFF